MEIKGTTKIITSSNKEEFKNVDIQPVGQPVEAKVIQDSTTSNSKKAKSLMKDYFIYGAEFLNNKVLSKMETIYNLPQVVEGRKKISQGKNSLVEKYKKAKILFPILNKCAIWVDYSVDYILKPDESKKNRSEVVQYTRGPALFGIGVSILTMLFFLIWGVWAPLNSAASVRGQLVLESKKRILQHQSGGLISRVYVKDGDEVEKGELLISLDQTSLKAKVELFKLRVLNFEAENARLLAERDNLSAIKFPEEILKNISSHEIAKLVMTQEKLFRAKKAAFEGKIKVREEKVKQTKAKLLSVEEQLKNQEQQIILLNEQIESYNKLASKGNTSKDNVRRLNQQLADFLSRKSGLIAELNITNDAVQQELIDIENEKAVHLSEIERELRYNQDQLSQNKSELLALDSDLQKLDIVAPISGVVSNLTNHTEGGTISPGQMIMEIIPQDDKLIFEGKLDLNDIDVVRVGQSANVRLMPFKSRVVPPIDGKVISVSADIVMPQYQGDVPHYKVKIEFDRESINEVLKIEGVELHPGMQGEGLIVVGNRTLLRYLLDPITMSFRKAFIEQ